MKVIILNGPAFSGKDTIADMLVEKYNRDFQLVEKRMFKEKLVQAALLTSGVSQIEWDNHYTREFKELPWGKLLVNGIPCSPRQYLIHISETVMKPLFGDQVFGLAAAETLQDETSIYVFSDGGFESEMKPLIKKAGEGNFFLARLHREGCDFTGDSRKHIYLGIDNEADFYNNSTIEEISEEIWQWILKN